MLENQEIRDNAGEPIKLNKQIIEQFRLGLIGVIGYHPGINDGKLVEFLNEIRKIK